MLILIGQVGPIRLYAFRHSVNLLCNTKPMSSPYAFFQPPDLCEHQEGNLTMLVLGDNSVAMLQAFQMYAGGNQLVQFTLENTHFTERNERSNYSLIFYLHQNDEGANLTHSLPSELLKNYSLHVQHCRKCIYTISILHRIVVG